MHFSIERIAVKIEKKPLPTKCVILKMLNFVVVDNEPYYGLQTNVYFTTKYRVPNVSIVIKYDYNTNYTTGDITVFLEKTTLDSI